MTEALKERIGNNLRQIQDRMAQAAVRSGREPSAVAMVAVTKYVGQAETQALLDLGVAHLGENRLEKARPKIEAMQGPAVWHMIGNVQRRKARDIVALFDWVDAVDRLPLAEALQRRCEETGKTLRVLAEVNVSGESQKHGFAPADLPAALDAMAALDRIEVRGLMTMAPYDAGETTLRRVFSELRELAGNHALPTVSMGMTNDFEIAIEEGSTQIRIGRALFA